MNGQFIKAARPEGIYARIGPEVGTVASVATEFNIVLVRSIPFLPDKYELVL